MAGLAAGVVVGHVPILKRSVEGGNSGHKRLTNGNNGQKIDESPLRHDLCNRIVWICQKGRYGESNRSLPLAHVPGRIAWFPGANLLKKNSRSCLMKPLSRSRLVAIRALAMEVAKEAFLPEEGEMKSDRGKYKMDGGLSTIYRPPPNRADDPSLGNPLLRLKRMGCGWLGVIIEWEGVIVEDDPDLESKAWLALAEEEGKRPPPAFILKRVEGMKNEQALSEVLCWSRDPVHFEVMVLLDSVKGRMHSALPTLSCFQATPLTSRNSGTQICRAHTAASTPNNLFQDHDFVRLLELPTSSKSTAAFSQALTGGLFQNGTIHAIVSPDIRSAFSFPIFNLKLEITRGKISAEEDVHLKGPTQDVFNHYWQVRTIAAQMRMPCYLHNRMLNAAKEIHTSGKGGSLLFVSGGHPFRRHWPINGVFPDSFSLLHTAHGLRKSGLISSGVEFWAVENPLVNSVDRLEKKIRAGAEAFIVQPPLMPDCFARWWDEANMRGLLDATKVIVGLPLITSARNFAFWLHLTQATGKEAKVLLQEFQRAEAFESGKGMTKGAFCRSWNLRIIETIKSLPKVYGMHLMPITVQGWRQLAFLLGEGKL